jgi:hypothetical protein
VTGEIRKNKLEWKGHQSLQGTRTNLSFANFEIEENGTVFARGTDEVGDFSINGKLLEDRNKIEWSKKYLLDGHKEYYQGTIN